MNNKVNIYMKKTTLTSSLMTECTIEKSKLICNGVSWYETGLLR